MNPLMLMKFFLNWREMREDRYFKNHATGKDEKSKRLGCTT